MRHVVDKIFLDLGNRPLTEHNKQGVNEEKDRQHQDDGRDYPHRYIVHRNNGVVRKTDTEVIIQPFKFWMMNQIAVTL